MSDQKTLPDLEEINIDVEELEPANSDVLEFNFVDSSNIICGICSQVVPYYSLFTEHMANKHPEFAEYIHEEAPSLKGSKDIVAKFKPKVPRKLSKIRVNTQTMSLKQLEFSLRKKMAEKMGREILVSLVDTNHARCGICNAILSLGGNFNCVNLVGHYNSWHPAEHKCSGQWLRYSSSNFLINETRPLSVLDFAVINLTPGASNTIQCIYCGVIMSVNSIAMHFHEIHPDGIEIPNCRLCLYELVANSRFTEKFGDNMDITLPDEHHFKCGRFGLITNINESAMDRAITRELNERTPNNDELNDEEGVGPKPFVNSHMTLDKRGRPKRNCIMPTLRQTAPINSEFVSYVSDCHWICKICNSPILAAVISSGAIKHFRKFHADLKEKLQFELCKMRLDFISDGCIEFLGPTSFECLICDRKYPLHRAFNLSDAIGHLKFSHAEQMPENNVASIDHIPQNATMDEEGEI